MRYEQYEQRVQKIENFLKLVFKHMTKIIISAATVFVITVTLLATRGIIVSAESCPESITYGEELSYRVSAFMSGVGYEYSPLGKNEWTKDAPKEPGVYNVRAAAKATFGYRYGEPETFEIKPKATEVSITSSSVVYGNHPEISANLAYEDKIYCDSFIYNSERNIVEIDMSALRVIDADGNDATARYYFTTAPKSIVTEKRSIEIAPADATKIYDGTPLVASEYRIISGSVAEGDTILVTYAGSASSVGTSYSSVTCQLLNALGDDVTSFYSITRKTASLTVTKRPVTVSTPSASFVYDALEHSVKEYAVEGEYGLAPGQKINITSGWEAATDAKTFKNSFKFVIVDEQGENVSANYDITANFGNISIEKRPVTLRSGSYSGVYDAEHHANESFETVGLVGSHELIASAFKSIFGIGQIENSFDHYVSDADGNDVSENYIFTYEWGTLTVTKKAITVTTATESKVYDGEALFNTELDKSLLAGADEYSITAYESIKNVGTRENVIAIRIINGETDVTDNYDITYVFGNLSVTPKSIILKSADATFVYNGKEQFEREVSAYDGYSLADGDVALAETYTTVKNVTDSAKNVVTVRIYNALGEDVTANYEIIEIKFGTLSVSARDAEIHMGSNKRVYDGTVYTVTDFTAVNMVDGHNVIIKKTTEIINASSVANVLIEYDITDENGESVKDNYNIKTFDGVITVTKRPLSLKTSSAEKIYDGTPLISHEWIPIIQHGGGLLEGHSVSAPNPTGMLTGAGEVYNTFECIASDFIVFDADGNDVTANYEITELLCGTLKVNPRPITVKHGSLKEIYSDEAYSNVALTDMTEGVSDSGLVSGHYFDVLGYMEFINVADSGDNIIIYRIMSADGDVTDNYVITDEYGKAVILPRPITVKHGDINIVYDGTYHASLDLADITGINENAGLVKGHGFVVIGYEMFRNVIFDGTNVIAYKIISSYGSDVTENYDITNEYGTVTITHRKITVTTETFIGVYDAEEHGTIVTVSAGSICEGHIISPDLNYVPFKNVTNGKIENVMVCVIIAEYGDVTANYEITYVYGKVEIKPRPITVTTDSYIGIYDGKVHADGYKITSGTLCDWQTMVLIGEYKPFKNVTGGVLENVMSHAIYDGEEDVTSNYEITYVYGKVEIKPRPITVTTDSYIGIYDGKVHADGYKITSGTLCDWQTIVLIGEYKPFKNVTGGVLENVMSHAIYDGEEDVTSNYEITYVYGKVEIKPRPITVTTDSYIGIYDGKVHADGYKITSGEVCDGQTLVRDESYEEFINVTAGFVDNVMKFHVYEVDEDVTKNYDITVIYGRVKISPRSISVVSASAEKFYDGKPLVKHVLRRAADSEYPIVNGHTLVADFTGTITNVGWVSNTYSAVRILDASGTDVTANYTIVSYQYGTLTVYESIGNEDSSQNAMLGNGQNIGLPPLVNSDSEEEIILFTITSDTSGLLYLKFNSLGEYTKNGWELAEEYGSLIFDEASAAYITAYALEKFGVPESYITIKTHTGQYVLPYYSSFLNSDEESKQISDVTVDADRAETYSLVYYLWNYNYADRISLPDAIKSFDEDYYKFVCEQYLKIDSETLAYLKTVIIEQGFDAADPDIISKVALYIQNSAIYSKEYDRGLDRSDNIVIAFLDEYREGVCQHYASAATMLFRALGIPARYTVGVVAGAVAGQSVEVDSSMAHAWTEVYIKGIGWVPVEVTGSSVDNPANNKKQIITVAPKPMTKVYDGKPLFATEVYDCGNGILDFLLSRGYTYTVVIDGSQTELGVRRSVIKEIHLFDPDGKEVTDKYEFVFYDGKLTVTKGIIEIYLYEKVYEYDGKWHTFETDEFVQKTKLDGIEVVITEINISLRDVGRISTEQINSDISHYIKYRVYKDGVDVTDNVVVMVAPLYGSSSDYTVMTIKPRAIKITTASATASYTGAPLTKKDGYYVSFGTLAEGHTLYIEVIGSITAQGEIYNTVNMESIKITDALGNDVTLNYSVLEVVLGLLKIT